MSSPFQKWLKSNWPQAHIQSNWYITYLVSSHRDKLKKESKLLFLAR